MVAAVTVDSLTATPGLQSVKLAFEVTDPHARGLPRLSKDVVQIVSNLDNNRDYATEVGAVEDLEFNHNNLAEEVTRYYWARGKDKSGAFGDWFPSSPTGGVAATPRGMSGLSFGLANGKIVVTENSPSSNQLTIAVKTKAGTDPSESNPVYYAFQTSDGSYEIQSITAALSFTITNGSTLGTTNNIPFNLWFVLIDDAGTTRIGAIVCTTSTVAVTLDEGRLITTVAEGGAGGADTAGVFYANAVATNKSFRVLGYASWQSGLSTAGNWGTAPSFYKLFSAGMKKPGEVVQRVRTEVSTVVAITSNIPDDDTIPQIGEGDLVMTRAITPTSAVNYFDHRWNVNIGSDARYVILALFKDGGSNAFVSDIFGAEITGGGAEAGDFAGYIKLVGETSNQAGGTSAQSYTLRMGVSGGSSHVNGNPQNTDPQLGGTLKSSYTIYEIMA